MRNAELTALKILLLRQARNTNRHHETHLASILSAVLDHSTKYLISSAIRLDFLFSSHSHGGQLVVVLVTTRTLNISGYSIYIWKINLETFCAVSNKLIIKF